MKPTLSVIIPVFNEHDHIGGTLQAAAAELQGSFKTDFVVVDDGSTDGTAEAALKAGAGSIRVIQQPNQGRLAARRTGLKAATGDYVLFLDSRVALDPGGAAFVAERLAKGELVWNGHVDIETAGNPYGRFWKVLTELAFAAYFDDPRTTSFGLKDFDSFPKGTTCFLAPTDLMRRGLEQFRTGYSDDRNANDDTPILRWVGSQQVINISPSFSCRYRPRSTLSGFVRHAEHRGVVFLDGHGHRKSRFFPFVIGFYPLSVVAAVVAIRRPWIGLGLVAGTALAAGSVGLARGKSREDAVSFGVLAPVYVAAHGVGMWRGLMLMLTNRLGQRPAA